MREASALFCFVVLLAGAAMFAVAAGYGLYVSGCCTERTVVGLPIFFFVVTSAAIAQL
jgi:hypothetical protein